MAGAAIPMALLAFIQKRDKQTTTAPLLGDGAIARALARSLAKRLGRRPLVIDPVLRSTSGALLFRGNPRRDYAALFARIAR